MDKHNRYFQLAKRLSCKSDHHQHKLGCVIVKGNSVISTGYNQIKTHPLSPHAWKMVHAEFSAVLGISASDLKGSTVYVYRETKSGELALAKPCIYCHKMLENCDIKTVYYTIKGGIESFNFY
jgi:deoxycytidylate deaminase